jgi:predicted GNAT family N-acyltransferase
MNAYVRKLTIESNARPTRRPYTVTVARSLDELMQAVALRAMVYMGEQGCPYDEEFDGNDFVGATHLILRCGGEPVGVARLRWFADFCKLERLAIRQEHRSVPALLALAREAKLIAGRKGYRRMIGYANERIAKFWRRYFNGRPRRDGGEVWFSDHRYLEMELDIEPTAAAINIDTDPMVLLRPEGDWDRPGVLERRRGPPAPAGGEGFFL